METASPSKDSARPIASTCSNLIITAYLTCPWWRAVQREADQPLVRIGLDPADGLRLAASRRLCADGFLVRQPRLACTSHRANAPSTLRRRSAHLGWWTGTSTAQPEVFTSSPWLRWSTAARVGHFRTWRAALGSCTFHVMREAGPSLSLG